MRWGSREGTFKSRSTLPPSAPPVSPVSATTNARRLAPACTPRITFGLFPLVESATEDVSGSNQRFNLARKDPVEAHIVRGGRKHGGIRSQGHGRQAGAALAKTDDELRGQVKRVGRASSIAEEHDFPAGAEGLSRAARELRNSRDQVVRETLLHAAAFLKLRDDVLPVGRHDRSAKNDLVAVPRDAASGVARIHDESGCLHDALIVVAGMVRGDEDAVVAFESLGIQGDGFLF